MPNISQMQGSPWHKEFLRLSESDEKRHRSHCIYFCKDSIICSKTHTKCIGSSHCHYYTTKYDRVSYTESIDDRMLKCYVNNLALYTKHYLHPELLVSAKKEISISRLNTLFFDCTEHLGVSALFHYFDIKLIIHEAAHILLNISEESEYMLEACISNRLWHISTRKMSDNSNIERDLLDLIYFYTTQLNNPLLPRISINDIKTCYHMIKQSIDLDYIPTFSSDIHNLIQLLRPFINLPHPVFDIFTASLHSRITAFIHSTEQKYVTVKCPLT